MISLIEINSRIVVPMGRGEERIKNCWIMGVEFSFCEMKKLQRLMHDMNTLNTVHLKIVIKILCVFSATRYKKSNWIEIQIPFVKL